MDYEYTQYIGIAIDEPVRLDRVVKTSNQISLLDKYRYTEEMAFDLCKKYDLLSLIYDFAPRGGCWFCPNARDCELRYLRNNHKDLWDKLLELEKTPNLIGNIWNRLTQTSIHDKGEQFMWEDRQMNIFDYIKESEVCTFMSDDLISRKAIMSHIESEYRQWDEDYDTEQIFCIAQSIREGKIKSEVAE